ncbi:TetR/AcrR family transcriptional regulator, partial [Butyricicoccus sp. 1XD8-22]
MPRGRRVNSNGERSKQLLLSKAIELFSINGYYETKISDIVKSADLTQPTFYLYFQSKESLYKDLNEQFKVDFFEIVNKELDS